jgi:threonine dehydrogenase-like Zn-dependent dehydrogenase
MAAQSAHIRAGIDVVRRGGRVSLMGGVRDDIAFNYASFMHRNLTLKGGCISPTTQQHADRFFRHMDVHPPANA